MSDPRRDIPSVDRLLGSPPFESLFELASRARVANVLRELQRDLRAELAAAPSNETRDADWFAREVLTRLRASNEPRLRTVINATGVVLHTNLGRAPLAPEAVAALNAVAAGYSNLEYDLAAGARGSRYDHCRGLLTELTGCEDALVVNNNAAALVLALNTLAREREAIVSRGELVEIGGSFRVPEIMERSGARLREVGSTNRTHLSDYQEAVGSDTAAILKVHRSNFQITGFATEVEVAELSRIARQANVPLLFDLGSGLLFDLRAYGFPAEPMPQDAIARGADLITMSGDKLLGGPQAGIILGKAGLIGALRRNPLCRALRVDKLTLAALEATLRLYREPEDARRQIPALRMLTSNASQLMERAQVLATRLSQREIPAEAVPSTALVGGGAYPDFELASAAVCVGTPEQASRLDRSARLARPGIVGRIVQDRFALDLRTVDPSEEPVIERVIARVWSS
jgi:L-seryl-tRNA(Ser) seleniumtransferase